VETLSKDLSLMHGKGFGLSNVKRMRQLYQVYPIGAKPSRQLSWSHYVELLKLDDPLERNFYEKQSILENWSVPELIRQKNASLFLRLAASRDKDGIMKLSQKGQIVQQPADIFREPYITRLCRRGGRKDRGVRLWAATFDHACRNLLLIV
jgi:uncharacterized protein DUF1016